jgi:hypothetical protein
LHSTAVNRFRLLRPDGQSGANVTAILLKIPLF